MSGTGLAQKYTLEKYCSKSDVSKLLGTNLIEPIWKQISDFRKQYSIELPIYDASFIRFFLVYIDSVQGKTAQANSKITLFVGGISKLTKGSIAYSTFTRDMLKNSLKAIAKHNGVDASEITLTNIIQRKPVDYQYSLIERYCIALNELRNNSYGSIDDSFLAKYYAILRGEDELTSFYRESDVQTSASKALVDRDYDQGVPSRLIDPLMNALFDYINSSEVSIVSRLSVIFFIFNYVKPFELYNMELASLLAKRIISTTSIDTSSIYVPLESFINDNAFFSDISREVKRTRDFTYAFLRGSDLINSSFDFAIDRINDVHSNSLDTEVKMGGDERRIKEEFGFEAPKPQREPVEKVPTKKEIIAYREKQNNVHEMDLSEKEIKAKINDLLERDPFLKKGQANFYARHCTPGKYYTLQQYMKCEHCVYETARTSLSFLAERGYYRQERIKNKFVYTPINKE